MKKSLYALAVVGALAATTLEAQAADPGFYIGGGVVNGSGEWENLAGNTLDNDTSGSGFKLGFIVGNGNRLELSYNTIDIDFTSPSAGTQKVTGFDMDYLVTFGDSQFKPYVGVGIGTYTFKDTAWMFTDNKDLKGFAFNLSLGAVYELVPNLEVEAALRFKAIESEDIQSGGTTSSVSQSMSNLYLGANFRF